VTAGSENNVENFSVSQYCDVHCIALLLVFMCGRAQSICIAGIIYIQTFCPDLAKSNCRLLAFDHCDNFYFLI